MMSNDEIETVEQQQATVSGQVQTVVDHLHANRTTETEARNLQEAARRSLVDHAASKAFR